MYIKWSCVKQTTAERPTWKVTAQNLHSHPNACRRPPLWIESDILGHCLLEMPELWGVIVCVPLKDLHKKNQHCSGYWTGKKKNTQEHRSSSARLPWPTFGKLVLLSMMKFQSFPFRLCATLYFLTNARLSVAAPLPASPPLAPWVMTPRTVLAKPRSTCRV